MVKLLRVEKGASALLQKHSDRRTIEKWKEGPDLQ